MRGPISAITPQDFCEAVRRSPDDRLPTRGMSRSITYFGISVPLFSTRPGPFPALRGTYGRAADAGVDCGSTGSRGPGQGRRVRSEQRLGDGTRAAGRGVVAERHALGQGALQEEHPRVRELRVVLHARGLG